MDNDKMVWLYVWIAFFILLEICGFCSCLAKCLQSCEEDKEEARVSYNPELGQVTVPTPTPVAGLPPGHYVYVIKSETNSEVPPPPYPGS